MPHPTSAVTRPAGRESGKVLVVDDEPNIADVVAGALGLVGFTPVVAHGGREALHIAASHELVALVLDVMLPDLDGFEVCALLRAKGVTAPVLFLTARTDPADAMRGLGLGGDDYLRKPFHLGELVARVQSICRRTGAPVEGRILRYADIEVDVGSYRVTRAGRPIDLTPTEFRLLKTLVRNGGRILTRPQLVDLVWIDTDPPDSATVETFVSRVRRKLETDEPSCLRTRRGVGYGLLEEEP